MVRPRFAKLPAQQQQAILKAALDEFAGNGFHRASLNRIIEGAGISKGSMYYYFDGKDDLYAYLARTELERLVAAVAQPELAAAADPEQFWSSLTDYYLRLMVALEASPQLAGLIRGWLAESGNPASQSVLQQAEEAVLPWVAGALADGQRVGAVRRDLPAGLLVAVVLGMGQAMDSWVMTQQSDPADSESLFAGMVEMIRRALAP